LAEQVVEACVSYKLDDDLRLTIYCGDCGVRVLWCAAVAALTVRIEATKEHLSKHKKDKATRRGMEGMMTKRRNLLKVGAQVLQR